MYWVNLKIFQKRTQLIVISTFCRKTKQLLNKESQPVPIMPKSKNPWFPLFRTDNFPKFSSVSVHFQQFFNILFNQFIITKIYLTNTFQFKNTEKNNLKLSIIPWFFPDWKMFSHFPSFPVDAGTMIVWRVPPLIPLWYDTRYRYSQVQYNPV